MSVSRWLRNRSERYLLISAQDRLARSYNVVGPRRPHGAVELFWRRIFAPIYRVMPWPLRHKIMLAMPGSHRRQWAPPPTAAGSALE